MLPSTAISRLCPWAGFFPTNHAERRLAATNFDAPQYLCGYSPDIVDIGAAGNTGTPGQTFPDGRAITDSVGFFVYCGGSWDECLDRMGNRSLPTTSGPGVGYNGPVQIERDNANHLTGRFGGIHFDPPLAWRGIAYTSGTKQSGLDNPNLAKFDGDYFPLIYGTAFVNPPVMNVVGNPNSTKLEVVLCVGEVWDGSVTQPGPIQAVVVNDYVVPFRPQSNDPTILGWSWINTGSRRGSVNRDLGYDGKGDPYGNLAAILIVVPVEVAASNSVPNVQVLTQGPKIRRWTSPDPADYDFEYTGNFALVVADLLTKCKFGATQDKLDLDLRTFLASSVVSDVPVTYTDLTGTTRTHTRYHTGVAYRQRRTAADIFKNLLPGGKAILLPNLGFSNDSNAGRLQIFIYQTLADQQPNPIAGSNYNLPVASFKADQSPANGYVAYKFDSSNVARKGPDQRSPLTFRIQQRPISDTPNKLSVSFQDEDYYYNNDGLLIDDSSDISRINQEVGSGTSLEGIPNWDQGKRALQTMFFNAYRGNPRTGFNGQNDSGGTWIAEFETTFRAIHLVIGHIILIGKDLLFTDDDQLFRITSIAVAPNFERMTIRAVWHEDDPYTDVYGQQPDPILEQQLRKKLARPPFGWAPDTEAPIAHDAIFDPTDLSFGLNQTYESAADGTTIAKLTVTGLLPVNKFGATQPPYAPQAETTAGGGAIGDITYYGALCGVDSNGLLSPPSKPLVQISTSGGASLITVPNIFWPDGNTGWVLYGGTNPNKLTRQAHGSGTPHSITIDHFKVADQAEPDIMFDHMEFRITRVWRSGVMEGSQQAVNSITSDSFKTKSFGFTVDQFAGYYCSIVGQPNSKANLPIADFLIVHNTSDTFFIGGGLDGTTPDLTTILNDGDIVVFHMQANISSANTIGDANVINNSFVFSAPVAITNATNTSPIVLTLSTPFPGLTGDTIRIDGVIGNDAANNTPTNGGWDDVVVSADGLTVTLPGSTGNGDYQSGGVLRQIKHGFSLHEHKGRIARIWRGLGAGQTAKIVDNDHTTCTIEGAWAIVPDSTSLWTIEDPAEADSVPTKSTQNSDPTTPVSAQFTVDNYLEQTLRVQAFTVSADGNYSVAGDSPSREIYLFGGDMSPNTQFDKATFGVAIINDVVVGTDVTPHYIVRRPGSPISVKTTLKIPPLGSSLILDIILHKQDGSYTGSIFQSGNPNKINVPASSTDIETTATFLPDIHFDEDDVLTVDVIQVGSSQPGRVISVVLKWPIG